MRKSRLPALALLVLLIGCRPKLGFIRASDSIFTDTMVEMTWPEIRKAAQAEAVVLLPVAVVEEHGPHLDLSADIYQTCIGCRYVKEGLERQGIKAVIAPPYYWGISAVVSDIPGSFSIQESTFRAMLSDIIGCLKAWGFKYVVVSNLHGDATHRRVLEDSIKTIREELHIAVYTAESLPMRLDRAPSYLPPRKGSYSPDYHAGASETGLMYRLYPQSVRTRIAKTLKPADAFHPLGYVGDPASYRLETRAVENLRVMAETGVKVIKAFLEEEKAKGN